MVKLSVIGILLTLSLSGCSNKAIEQPKDIKDGALVISGDLTYEKIKEAMAPLMKEETESNMDLEEKEINIDRNFCGIDVCYCTAVEFRQSETLSAKVFIPKELKNLVKIEYSDGCLEVDAKDAGGDNALNRIINSRNNSNNPIILKISAPRLSNIEMSGASSITVIGDLKQTEGLSIDVSGASNVSCQSFVSGGSLEIDLSGASNIGIGKVETNAIDIDLSGASNIALQEIKTRQTYADVSGASNISMDGSFGKVEADVSGCSKMKVKGTADKVSLEASGMSEIDIKSLDCKNITTETSGMSKIKK